MRRIVLIFVMGSVSVAPGWAQEVNVQIPKGAQVQYGGMLKPFSYVNSNARQPAPQAKTAKPPSKQSPRNSGSAFRSAPAIHEGLAPANAQLVARVSKPFYQRAAAPVTLSADVVKVPAETASGYCLRAPSDYVGTGSANRPAVSAGLPRCEKAPPAP